ncbi:hypothetical protein ACWGJ2_00525 [Streptomyces sp. NPDC054796]
MTAPGDAPGGVRHGDETRAETFGPHSAAIGRVGQVILSLFAGDVGELYGRAKHWSGWNWPPFLLVVTLTTIALVTAPDGPARQLGWVYAVLGVAVVVSFARVVGVPDGRSGVRRGLMTGGSLLLAVLGLIGMDHYADHGEVAVTGTARLIPNAPAGNGAEVELFVDNTPRRSTLRLALTAEDSAPGAQTCTPETEFAASLVGGGAPGRAEGIRPGEAVEFPLGGQQGNVRVRFTVTTDEGCLMRLSVAEATLHDCHTDATGGHRAPQNSAG